MELKKEWFEPGPDGKSPFVREYEKTPHHTCTSKSISAAFRALLAESEAVELGIGDWVRLEAYSINSMPDWVGKEARIVDFDPESCDGYVRLRADGIACEFGWKHTALTLVRRAGEVDGKQEENRNGLKWFDVHLLHAQLHARNDEIVGLRAEVERWKSIADAHEQNYNMMLKRIDEVAAERDALQARVDGGVRVWSIDSKDWHVERCLADNHSATLLIDHIADPGKMVDERKGKADRRMTHAFHYYKPSRRKYIGHTQYQSNTVEWARYNDRRRTAGTIADRKGN